MSNVVHDIDGSVWLAEIARPQRVNALRGQTIRELEAVVGRAEAQHSAAAATAEAGVSGVIVTGGPRRCGRRRRALEARRASIDKDRRAWS